MTWNPETIRSARIAHIAAPSGQYIVDYEDGGTTILVQNGTFPILQDDLGAIPSELSSYQQDIIARLIVANAVSVAANHNAVDDTLTAFREWRESLKCERPTFIEVPVPRDNAPSRQPIPCGTCDSCLRIAKLDRILED